MADAISAGAAGRPARAMAARASHWPAHASVPSVRVGPGLTALTRTPLGPNSAAQDLVSRVSAALLDPYRPMPATPKWATMVSTLMIAPCPRAAMVGASLPTRMNGALTLTAYTVSMSASLAWAVGPNGKTPALLPRMSTWPPPSSMARRASARTDLASARLAAMKWALRAPARVG